MSTNSSIEWTDTTWNPVAGCSIVSPGCTNCYAMRMAARLEAMGQAKYAGLTKKVNGNAVWTGKINLDNDAVLQPLSWKKSRRVFVNSMSDLFHEGVPFDFVDKVFAVMAFSKRHVFQILTKRPDRMAEYMERTRKSIDYLERPAREIGFTLKFDGIGLTPWPLPSVWLGTSVENQKAANERIPHLLKCQASVRFLSCEPLLGPLDLSLHSVLLGNRGSVGSINGEIVNFPGIDWVIVGGESGPGSRPMVLGWVKDIVRQCKAAGVAAFVKQMGANPTNREGERCTKIKDSKGGNPAEWPVDLRVREFPNTKPEVVTA